MNSIFSILDDFIILVIVGICMCVGYILKKAVCTDKIDRFTPLIMAALGLALNIWINDLSITPEIVLGGLLSGLSSLGLYEAFSKFLKNKN